jgi:hypothetical protein
MYSAPSVSYHAGRSRFQGLMTVLLWLAAAALWVTWVFQVEHLQWRQWLTMLVLLLSGTVAGWIWWRTPTGILQWNTRNLQSGQTGPSWLWQANHHLTQAGTISVHLDFQRLVLLLHTCEQGRRRWLWLAQRTDPSNWMALRRAVFAHPRVQARQTP